MCDSNPSSIINLETGRIPLKASNMTSDWSPAFRSWPSVTPGWRNWFCSVAGSYRATWEQYDISRSLDLSLSEMVKNEPMLISASFFWSDAINAFLFGHGPMTPTLLDVMMLTGLNITAPDRSFDFLNKASFKIETRTIGGWKRICHQEHENWFCIAQGTYCLPQHVAREIHLLWQNSRPNEQHPEDGRNSGQWKPSPPWQAPARICLSSTSPSISQTQGRSVNLQSWRSLVVYPVMAEHVYAQDYENQAIRNVFPIRRIQQRRRSNHSPMYLLRRSSHHDCQ